MNKFWKILKNSVLATIIIFSLMIIASSVGFFDYKSYVVRTGSMEPNIKVGSIVLDKNASVYKVGDVITFKRTGFQDPVTHRIVSVKTNASGESVYTVKGDANSVKDTMPVAESSVIGKVSLSLPYIGYANIFIKTLPGLLLCIIIPATIIIYSEALSIGKEVATMRNKKRKTANISAKKADGKPDGRKSKRKIVAPTNKKRAPRIVMGAFLAAAGIAIIAGHHDSSIATLTDSVTSTSNSVTSESRETP